MNTLLITGCSTGFGLETARYFFDRGWKVIATMRSPREDVLPRSERIQVVALDVTDNASVQQAVAAAGPVDVLVNNAGVGLGSVVEGTSIDAIRALFETNFFGAVALTQALIPSFRQRKAGLIVNVSSSVTLKPVPLLAAYSASKAALNAFTESMAIELAPFGIRCSLVLPGQASETAFSDNALRRMQQSGVATPEPYGEFVHEVMDQLLNGFEKTPGGRRTSARDVAEAIWNVVHNPDLPVRQPAGADAVAWATAAGQVVGRQSY